MFGNTQQGGGGKDQFIRLTGVFQTKKGNWIGRIKTESFNAIFELMKDANSRQDAQGNKGTLNLIIAPNKQSGKPELYAVVGDPYSKNQGGQGNAGPFGSSFGTPQATPAPVVASQPFGGPAQATPAPAAREVAFGKADVPVDEFDKLLENL